MKENSNYPNDLNELNALIKNFQRETDDNDDENDNEILGEKKLISLLSWTAFLVLLIYLMILEDFLLLLVNLDILGFICFIFYIYQNITKK